MSGPPHVTIFAEDWLKRDALSGQNRFLHTLLDALQGQGFSTEIRKNSAEERAAAQSRPGHALFHAKPPFPPRGLSFRKTYFDPFWSIQATEKRWEFTAAQRRFDPARIDPNRAAQLVERQRGRLFSGFAAPGDDGFVYVPLQGRLLDHRSFQTVSPIGMLNAVARHFAPRPVVATLHPKERYSSRDMAAVEQAMSRHDNLTLAQAGPDKLLPRCCCVVTQNSAIALLGYFYAKPAALFARVDFHHIAANAHALGVDGALDQVERLEPDYQRYLFWFLQRQQINVARSDAGDKMLKLLRSHGWPV